MKNFSVWVLLIFSLKVEAGVSVIAPRMDSIGSFPLQLAERYTTNLIFPFAIVGVDLGSGDVIAKKMGKTENVLLLKAGKAHFLPTNVSVYLKNGVLYSFRVTYADSLLVFNYSFGVDSSSRAA